MITKLGAVPRFPLLRAKGLDRAARTSKSALRLVGLVLVCLQALACADILGIDEPVARSEGAGGAPQAGAAGETSSPPRPFPKIQVTGAITGQVGSTPDPLMIDGPHSVSGCPDAQAEIPLSVGGGEGQYIWKLDPPDPSFQLRLAGAAHDRALLSGTYGTKPRTVSVRVTDKSGTSSVLPIEIEVSSVPVIAPPALGSICPDELYAFDFHASGGDEQHYVWSSDDLPKSSGLVLDANGHLAGKFTGVPSGPAQLKFTVNVADGSSCTAEPVKVSLTVNGAGATACPAIGVENLAQSRPLPPLCLGGDYNVQLHATGGTGPYSWAHSALPSGLSLDSKGKLSGTYLSSAPKPVPPASFAVQVTDNNGRRIERSELVPVREKCWFSYISSSGANAQLNFFDPLLLNRKTPPGAAAGQVAKDFKFSPNGRYVAYRLVTPAGATMISVIDLSTWQQNAPVFAGVTEYAWSGDSGTLAVAYSVGTDTVLGGLTVTSPLPGTGSAVVYPPLTAVVTPINSELVWYGLDLDQLAMIANVTSFSLLKTFHLDRGVGFASPVLQSDELAPPTWLKGTRSGVFAVPQIFAITFYPNDDSFPAFHDDVVIAPSGEYVAHADAGSLNVFHAIDDSLAPPPLSAPGCDSIASWASGTELVACAHETSNGGSEITFFGLAPGAAPSEIALSPVPTPSVPLALASARRRLFSTSGARFAFTTDQSVTIVNLNKTTKVSADTHDSTVPPTSAGAAFAELSFSPDEHLLMQHRGSRLSFYDVSQTTSIEITMSDALPPSLKCDENFRNIRDPSGGWCGAERPGVPFWWAPNSDLAAYQTANGTLHIYGFNDRAPYSVDDQCGQGCVVPGQVGFQP